MSGRYETYRFRVARRSLQAAVLLFFGAGSGLSWTVLRGNLSSSKILGLIPLTDPFAVLQTLAAGIVVGSQAWIGAGIVTLFFGLVAGRAFCGWVCPVNAVTDAAARFGASVGTSAGLLTMARNARYWILGLSLVLSTILGRAAFEAVSPVSLVHRGIIFGAVQGVLAVPALFLFDLLVLKRGFCGHLCPLGAFHSIIGRFSAVRVRHDRARCTKCMKCVDACPEPQVLGIVGSETGFITGGECSNCGRCIEACDVRAMAFSLRTFSRSR